MSVKDGLPYGWWKDREVWSAATTVLILIATILMGLALMYGWFANVQPST